MRPLRIAVLAAASLWLAGCDQLGLETAAQIAERREAEGKAIGGACRHAARSIEACYEQNKRADKAAIFAGWREMNDYMRENQLEPMPAPETTSVAAADVARAGAGAPEAAPADGDHASTKPAKTESREAGKAESKGGSRSSGKSPKDAR